MAYRWKDDGDAPSELMALNGIKTLPTTAQQWESISIRPRRQFSVPNPNHWLDQGEVFEVPIPLIPQPAGSTLPELARPDALFPLVIPSLSFCGTHICHSSERTLCKPSRCENQPTITIYGWGSDRPGPF